MGMDEESKVRIEEAILVDIMMHNVPVMNQQPEKKRPTMTMRLIVSKNFPVE